MFFLVTIDAHSPETTEFAPENQWLGDEFPFKIVPFQGTFVHCQGVAVYVWGNLTYGHSINGTLVILVLPSLCQGISLPIRPWKK